MRRQLRKQGLQGVAKEGAEKDGKDKIFLDIAFRGRMLAPEKDRRCRDRCLLGCVCTCTALYVRSSIQQLTSWGALVVPPLPTPSTFSCISLSVRLCYASMHLAHSGHVLSGPCVILPLKPHPPRLSLVFHSMFAHLFRHAFHLGQVVCKCWCLLNAQTCTRLCVRVFVCACSYTRMKHETKILNVNVQFITNAPLQLPL